MDSFIVLDGLLWHKEDDSEVAMRTDRSSTYDLEGKLKADGISDNINAFVTGKIEALSERVIIRFEDE